ncbi:MAG: DUF4838 domain-containing protein [Thermoguttaceae bacterium]|nr:DUF4838 domain-containing protein [Thermoguttaceae bacterium]
MRRYSFTRAAFAALTLLAAMPIFASEGTLRLAGGGVSDYKVVLPENPSAVQRTAAEELASFLGQVTGAVFPIISEAEAKDKDKLLVIGPGELSKSLLASAGAESEETLSQDGIILWTVGGSIVFSGHRDRGPLYAVCTFLEDIVGVRWWTSTESTIPDRPDLEVPTVSLRYEPVLLSRDATYFDRYGEKGPIFCARRKLNGHGNSIPPEYGGRMAFSLFVHTFYPILPPKQYFDKHPDWYALVDGRRQSANAQLCLTNPEMKEEFIRNTLRIIGEHPESKIISISQNDCGGWCQCPECKKLVEENKSQAGPLITFVNEVAEAVEEKYPDVLVETLAYNASRFAPANVRPRDNVLIRLCTIEYSFLTPLEEGGRNQSLVEQIAKWSAVSKQLFIWDYVTNFHNYMLPHPNLQVLSPNIRFFIKNNAVGVLEQGDTWCAAGDFVRMRYYLLSKLLWDPTLDQRRIENEFLTGYYSPGVAAALREYLDRVTECAVRSNINLRCYMDTVYTWLDTPTLVELTALMDRAIAAAREDEEKDPIRFAGLTDKVLRESIPVRLAWLRDWPIRQDDLAREQIPSPIKDGAAYYEQFRELIKRNNVTSAVEGGNKSFPAWLDALGGNFKPAPVPDEVKDLAADTWVTLEECQVNSPSDVWPFIVDDSAAENGRAIKLPGNQNQWGIGWDTYAAGRLRSISDSGEGKNGFFPVRVLLRVRCQGFEPDDQDALIVSVYDLDQMRTVFRKPIKDSELVWDGYKTIDLGTISIGINTRLKFTPAGRSEGEKNFFIDRMVIIRE